MKFFMIVGALGSVIVISIIAATLIQVPLAADMTLMIASIVQLATFSVFAVWQLLQKKLSGYLTGGVFFVLAIVNMLLLLTTELSRVTGQQVPLATTLSTEIVTMIVLDVIGIGLVVFARYMNWLE